MSDPDYTCFDRLYDDALRHTGESERPAVVFTAVTACRCMEADGQATPSRVVPPGEHRRPSAILQGEHISSGKCFSERYCDILRLHGTGRGSRVAEGRPCAHRIHHHAAVTRAGCAAAHPPQTGRRRSGRALLDILCEAVEAAAAAANPDRAPAAALARTCVDPSKAAPFRHPGLCRLELDFEQTTLRASRAHLPLSRAAQPDRPHVIARTSCY